LVSQGLGAYESHLESDDFTSSTGKGLILGVAMGRNTSYYQFELRYPFTGVE